LVINTTYESQSVDIIKDTFSSSFDESTRKAWREDARVVIRNLRAQGFDVTARAEQ
jgi:hypothetical protein